MKKCFNDFSSLLFIFCEIMQGEGEKFLVTFDCVGSTSSRYSYSEIIQPYVFGIRIFGCILSQRRFDVATASLKKCY